MIPTKKPCRVCKQPTANENGYCDAHQDRYVDYKKRYDKRRGSPSKRGYDRTWQRFRENFLQKHPLCFMCTQEGRLTPANEVHHIKPLAEGGARLDPDNCMPLCKACHSKITYDYVYGK